MSEDEASKAGQAKPNHYEAVQRILSDSPRPFEALALLAFYSHVASWQRDYRDTGLIQATTGFCAAGLKVSEASVRKAKRELMALGLVEDLKLSGAKHEILAWRIALNFDPFIGNVKARLPGSPYAGFSQPLDTAGTMSSKQDQIVEEDEDKQEQKQKPRESHPLVPHRLPEEAGRSPLPDSQMADGKIAKNKMADGKAGLGGDSHPQPIEAAPSIRLQADENETCFTGSEDFADDDGASADEGLERDELPAKGDSKPGNVQGQEAEGLKQTPGLLTQDSSKEDFIDWFEDFLSLGKDDPKHSVANAWLNYELLYRKYPKVRYDLFQKFLLLRKDYLAFERQFAVLIFIYKPSTHIQSLRNLADEAFKSGFVLDKSLLDVIAYLPEFCEFRQLFANDNWRSAMKLNHELLETELQLESWLGGKPTIWQLGQLADLLKELEASASSITEYREWNEDQKADNERFALSWALFLSKSRIQDFMRATEDTRRIRKETAEERRQRLEAAKKIMAFGEGLPEIKQIADDILHCRCTVQAGIRKFNHKMESYGLGESAFI